MRASGRMYYGVAAVTLAAVACLPWLVPLSYRVLGFEPRLARAGTFAAFQADLATASLRRQFLSGVLLLALALLALSIAADRAVRACGFSLASITTPEHHIPRSTREPCS